MQLELHTFKFVIAAIPILDSTSFCPFFPGVSLQVNILFSIRILSQILLPCFLPKNLCSTMPKRCSQCGGGFLTQEDLADHLLCSHPSFSINIPAPPIRPQGSAHSLRHGGPTGISPSGSSSPPERFSGIAPAAATATLSSPGALQGRRESCLLYSASNFFFF